MYADCPRPFRFEKHVGAASAPLGAGYRPRRPERTILYRAVQDHLETMLAEARERSAHGFGYPRCVERAFRRYLGCGQLANGFVRLRCQDCGEERLLPFSCKSRLCPSCHARRMHDTAFHLELNVLPRVPHRQWVLALPRPVRLPVHDVRRWLTRDHALRPRRGARAARSVSESATNSTPRAKICAWGVTRERAAPAAPGPNVGLGWRWR